MNDDTHVMSPPAQRIMNHLNHEFGKCVMLIILPRKATLITHIHKIAKPVTLFHLIQLQLKRQLQSTLTVDKS